MKRKIAVFLALAMMLTMFAAPAMAGDIKVVLDGKNVSFDVPPMIDNGRTLVPLRAIFEAMGATVSWDQTTQTATGTKGSTTVVLKIGSTSPTINGTAKSIDVPGQVVNGRTLAPLRFIGEAFGGTVNWDGATQTATITSPAAPTKPEVKPETKPEVKPETKPEVKPEVKPETQPDAAATADSAVKAAIAAFKPAKCDIAVNALVKGTSVGDINVKIVGKGSIAADKKASSNWTGELGALGNSAPSGAYCPFSELIAGPEAGALKIVSGAKYADNVITVTNVPVPASLKSLLDSTSQMVPVAFTLTMDAKITIDKATGLITKIEITKVSGTGVASIGTYETSGTATFTYTY